MSYSRNTDASPLYPVLPGQSGLALGLRLKRLFDFCAALTALILAAPLFIPLAILIRRDGGPVFFAHERIGRGGRRFPCLKFRTMVTDAKARLEHILATDPQAAAEWARDQKLRNDPRVTRVGRILRATSLDELPQLINVLRGDMSLVGPRPVVAEELERYGTDRTSYLRVRPGITGLWQVSGRNQTTYEERVALDVRYVETWSFSQDLIILIKTVREVLWHRSGF